MGRIQIRTLKEAISLITETLNRKGESYGPTYRRVALALGVPPQYSILVRMLEKTMRIGNLLGRSHRVQSEELAEEFLDLACYAILGLMESSPVNSEPKLEEKGKGDEWKGGAI